MNTKIFKTVIPVFLLISLACFSGCEKVETDTANDIYENHNISACGMNDPLQNIQWLKEYCDTVIETQNLSSIDIHLYKVVGTDENVFKINTSFPIQSTPEQGNTGYESEWKNCVGTIIFHIPYPGTPPNPEMVENFMADKEFVADTFHYVKQ